MMKLLPPDRLLYHGTPVYQLNQFAGEFVITFPRAYNAYFNNGFNFAETVNFCPAEWVRILHRIKYLFNVLPESLLIHGLQSPLVSIWAPLSRPLCSTAASTCVFTCRVIMSCGRVG